MKNGVGQQWGLFVCLFVVSSRSTARPPKDLGMPKTISGNEVELSRLSFVENRVLLFFINPKMGSRYSLLGSL